MNHRSRLMAGINQQSPPMSQPGSHPIGVFDSGIGGLTVVKALQHLLPEEQIVYLGDTARVPYGSRSASTVERYSREIAGMLVERDAKVIVVACNTVSSVALPQLETFLPVKVLGVIRPGAEAAVRSTRTGHVGVIGTRTTIRSGAYEKAIHDLNREVRVTSQPAPLLVPLIEEGLLNDEVTDKMILRYVEPMLEAGIDTLVLGCTHYPLLAPAMERLLGHDINLVDSAQNCALATQALLEREGLRAPRGSDGALAVGLTDAPDNFLKVAKEALRLELGEVELRQVLHGAPA